MFKRSLNTTVGFLLLLLLWHWAPVLAQEHGPEHAPFQLKVTGTCAPGSAIRVINVDGSVVCEVDNTDVTAVTASSPLVATGTTTPNIALPNVIIGSTTTAIGTNALQSNTGINNTASGALALLTNTTGRNNTGNGSGALSANTTGDSNTASGAFALAHNTTGGANTAAGSTALFANTTGSANTASGFAALAGNTTGSFNTASGYQALPANTTGGSNTAYGAQALFFNSTGAFNTAVGGALVFNTTGSFNTATGGAALQFNTAGSRNTASGQGALFSNTIGSSNTAIGFLADVSSGNLTNATAIGANAKVDASNKIRLGDSAITVIEATVGITTVSDKTKKENFLPVDGEEVLGKIRGLNLNSWNLIGHDPQQFRHYGPVAQEFFAAFGHDGIGTIGTPTTITSTDMAGVLMIAVQALEKRTVELQQETERLKEAVATLNAENAELKAR